MRFIFAILAAICLASPATAGLRVVASIVPVHSMVAAVMLGRGEPDLLLQGTLSEHTSGLSPAQLVQVGQADLVFMVDPRLEIRLGQLSASDTVAGKTFIMLADAPGVSHLPLRSGGVWEANEHDMETTGESAPFNTHVWLDPQNAKAMATAIAAALSKADPQGAATYAANAQRFAADLDATTQEIAALLAPVKAKPFVVFHDAFPYFEQRFGLQAVGSISDASAAAPSARRIGEIRDKIATTGAVCVFREPQFDSRFSDTVTEGTQARTGVLDAVGATLTPGPQAYGQLITNLAKSLATCLSGT